MASFTKNKNALLLTRICMKPSRRYIAELKDIMAKKISAERKKIKKFVKAKANAKIGDVTVKMVLGGMRGITGFICDTSHLDAEKGITYRGYTLHQCMEKLPKTAGSQPTAEGVFWLFLTGDIPTASQVKSLTKYFTEHSKMPDYIEKLLNNTPKDVHPLHLMASACGILSKESQFIKHRSTIKKTDYWKVYLEDSLNLFAKVPVISAKIYRNIYKDGGKVTQMDTSKCVTQNFCEMCGYKDKRFAELMRVYFILHSDHANGNVSSHATHLVGSALADAYISYAAGMYGLAGPLHGLANELTLRFMLGITDKLGKKPTDEQLLNYLKDHLKQGQVIPGYGHAILRKTDPRFLIQSDYAKKHCPNDDLVKLTAQLYKIVPPLLKSLGKVANPYPNVDAHSGVLLMHYGMKEFSYYTVLFAISRAMGVLSQLVWNRALGAPIERPVSVTSEILMKKVNYKP